MAETDTSDRSPFPGMDPYLEDPALWPDFHHEFMVGLRGVLAEQVAPEYIVRIDERVYVTEERVERARFRKPDLTIVAAPRPWQPPSGVPIGDDRVTAPFVIADLEQEEHRELFLVVQLRSSFEVITVIELLSPTNKRPGGIGSREYLKKRRHVLRSSASLVELDFLREGDRVPMSEALPAAHYYAIIHAARHRPRCGVFPFTVRDPMPKIPIPLRDREEVYVALQPVSEACFARARYGLLIDYTKPPVPPLDSDDAAWAAAL